MLSDSTKLLVDLRKEGSCARWQGQKLKIFFPAKKAVNACWDVVFPARPRIEPGSGKFPAGW
jgi:hypothetical protein